MEISLYKNQFPTGSRKSIQFVWEFGKLKIRTYEQHITVSDGDIDKRDGKYFITPRSLNRHHKPAEIEIPVTVIEQMDQLNINLKNSRESIGHVDHKAGKIFFSLNMDGKIIAKQGCKTAVSEMEIIENKKAIDIRTLGLEFPYLEIPANVVAVFVDAKYKKIMLNCHLIYVGKSLLTGKDYYKLNSWIPASDWNCVEDLFEDFGVSGSGLNGWLTNQPENVQKLLGLKPTNEHEDEVKKFEAAIVTIER